MLTLQECGHTAIKEFLDEVEREFPEYYQAYKVWEVKSGECRRALEALKQAEGPLHEAAPWWFDGD